MGNTVNIKKATYTNTIGDTQLSAVWAEPEFNPAHHADYYVRVLEIPPPRWSTYHAVKLGIDPPKNRCRRSRSVPGRRRSGIRRPKT